MVKHRKGLYRAKQKADFRAHRWGWIRFSQGCPAVLHGRAQAAMYSVLEFVRAASRPGHLPHVAPFPDWEWSCLPIVWVHGPLLTRHSRPSQSICVPFRQ